MTLSVPVTDLSDFWVHAVGLETYQGTSGAGVRLYAVSVTIPCYVERKRQFVRSANGEQVISSTQVYADVTLKAVLAPESRVTLDEGVNTVLSRETYSSAALGLPDHVVAYLQ